jgi:hypothetical protein
MFQPLVINLLPHHLFLFSTASLRVLCFISGRARASTLYLQVAVAGTAHGRFGPRETAACGAVVLLATWRRRQLQRSAEEAQHRGKPAASGGAVVPAAAQQRELAATVVLQG